VQAKRKKSQVTESEDKDSGEKKHLLPQMEAETGSKSGDQMTAKETVSKIYNSAHEHH